MQKLGFDTSPEKTTIIWEKLGVTVGQMAHTIIIVCSWVPNGFIIYIVGKFMIKTAEWGSLGITKSHGAVNAFDSKA